MAYFWLVGLKHAWGAISGGSHCGLGSPGSRSLIACSLFIAESSSPNPRAFHTICNSSPSLHWAMILWMNFGRAEGRRYWEARRRWRGEEDTDNGDIKNVLKISSAQTKKTYRNVKEKSKSNERKENGKKQTAGLSLRGSLVRVDTWPLLLLSSIPSLFSTLSRSRSLSPPSTWARVQRWYRHEARRWWGWGGGSFITLSLNLCISFSSCRQGSISIV